MVESKAPLGLVVGQGTEAFTGPGLRLIIELENEHAKGMKCTNTGSIDRTEEWR